MSTLIVEALIMQVEQIQRMLACLERLPWYRWTIKVSDAVMLLLSEKLNMHFSSVFTREDTSSLYLYHKQSSMGQRGNGWGS